MKNQKFKNSKVFCQHNEKYQMKNIVKKIVKIDFVRKFSVLQKKIKKK